jgi:hypothetical protein
VIEHGREGVDEREDGFVEVNHGLRVKWVRDETAWVGWVRWVGWVLGAGWMAIDVQLRR